MKSKPKIPRAAVRRTATPAINPLPERYYVQIQCADEAEQRRFYEQFRRAGRRVRVVTV